MSDGISTPPPPAPRVVLPSSPMRSNEFIVKFHASLTAQALGSLKVTSTTKLVDVHLQLLKAMGGRQNVHEVHLLKGNQLFDSPHSWPFARAVANETYGALLAPLQNMYYLDLYRFQGNRDREWNSIEPTRQQTLPEECSGKLKTKHGNMTRTESRD